MNISSLTTDSCLRATLSNCGRLRSIRIGTALLVWGLLVSQACADKLTLLTPERTTETVEARIVGDADGAYALQLSDGSIRVVSHAALRERESTEGPTPISANEMIGRLEEQFGAENIVAETDGVFLSALVLAAPCDKQQLSKVRIWLKVALKFQRQIQTVFSAYAKQMRLDLRDPEYPQVLLIFESEKRFEEYAQEVTGGRGLSATRIAGFYNGLTNWLAVRMGECHSFEVPLHEAIHQQVYNRGLFKRLAPIPSWFNEGIATGFENDGESIRTSPLKINIRYARQSQSTGAVSWSDLVQSDQPFRGDVLAGEAYTHGWCLHWMLARKYRDEYRDYVKLLGEREPLQVLSEDQRLVEFEKAFGQSVSSLQQEFPAVLEAEAKKQRLRLPPSEPPGYSITETGPLQVKMEAVVRVDQGGQLNLQGAVQNFSTFRDYMLYVAVVTDSGAYADWLLPSVSAKGTAKLNHQVAVKTLPGALGGSGRSFRVQVFHTIPGTEEAKAWASGKTPNLVE